MIPKWARLVVRSGGHPTAGRPGPLWWPGRPMASSGAGPDGAGDVIDRPFKPERKVGLSPALQVALAGIGALGLLFALGAVGPGAAAIAVAAIALAALLAWRRERRAGRMASPSTLLPSADASRRTDLARSGPVYSGLIPATEVVLDHLPDPLFVLDRRLRILYANAAARGLFGGELRHRHLSLALRNPPVLEAVETAAIGRDSAPVDFVIPVPVERHFRAQAAALGSGGTAAVLLVLQDMTSARRAEQMRVDFVANASHELRTPLAALSGFIETLRGPAREDAEARERFLEIMQEQAQRMGRLLRDLMSLSRIELNEHLPPTGRVDLAGVIRDVADGLSPIAAKARVVIRIALPEMLPPVRGDRDELFQVFQNLLDNAIKYGASGGEITVERHEAVETPSRMAVTVRDRGEGIPREHIPRLTERFYRVDAVRSRERGGTGLGLAIVKHILNRHQGGLMIESSPGNGSAFTVLLPRAEPAAERKRLAEELRRSA